MSRAMTRKEFENATMALLTGNDDCLSMAAPAHSDDTVSFITVSGYVPGPGLDYALQTQHHGSLPGSAGG